MIVCRNCILPDTFPGVLFDDEQVCNHCRKFKGKEERLEEDKRKYENKFLELLQQVRDGGPRSGYDLLMAYSGGKDSTYTMSLLSRKYGLKILAFSLDNGFLSDTARKNIDSVSDRLGVDQVYFKPKWNLLKGLFARAAKDDLFSNKTLERASTICTACIGLVKSLCLKTALEQRIPLIGFGWSPGQAPLQSAIMKNNPSLVRMTQRAILDPLAKAVGDGIDVYFLHDRHYSLPEEAFPYNVHPMAWEFYDERAIIAEIGKLGWVEPGDTDTNSSNCLLNAFANEVHIRKFGFHPYVWEIANMVRQGVMSREEGYDKIYKGQRGELVRAGRERLDL